jgi:hypothetical protein
LQNLAAIPILLGRRIDAVSASREASSACRERRRKCRRATRPDNQLCVASPQDFKNNSSPPHEVSEPAASSNLQIDSGGAERSPQLASARSLISRKNVMDAL